MNIPLNIDWQQIILHLLNFAILAGGLYFLLYHPVRKFMDQREEHYRQMENEAQQRLDQAKAAVRLDGLALLGLGGVSGGSRAVPVGEGGDGHGQQGRHNKQGRNDLLHLVHDKFLRF